MLYQANRMDNGETVKGFIMGESPFIYIIPQKDYCQATYDDSERLVTVPAIRVMEKSVKPVKQVYIASHKDDEECSPAIIFANSPEEAITKANAYFKHLSPSFLAWKAEPTEIEDVFAIE